MKTTMLTRGMLSALGCAVALGISGCGQETDQGEPGAEVQAEAAEIARRFVDQGLTWQQPALFDEIIAEDIVVHTGLNPAGPITGREDYKQVFASFAAAFTDIAMEIQDVFVEAGGERVVVRFRADATHTGEFFGMAATNRRISMIETHVLRIRDGRIVENRVSANNFEFEYLMAPVMMPIILPDQP